MTIENVNIWMTNENVWMKREMLNVLHLLQSDSTFRGNFREELRAEIMARRGMEDDALPC